MRPIDLEFNENGLIVVPGPSGAGKSIFMNAILANFGLLTQEAKICEIDLLNQKS